MIVASLGSLGNMLYTMKLMKESGQSLGWRLVKISRTSLTWGVSSSSFTILKGRFEAVQVATVDEYFLRGLISL